MGNRIVPKITFLFSPAWLGSTPLLIVLAITAASPFLRVQAATQPGSGLNRREEAPPFLGMPATPVFARPGPWSTETAFPNVTFRNPVFLEPEPGTRRLLVGELEGRIFAIDGANPLTEAKRLILDLSAHTQGGWDSGMLGLAFHPEYERADSPNRGYIYVFYSWVDTPAVQARPAPDEVTWTRLSRFKVDPATGVANPGSEQVLMNQRDRFIIYRLSDAGEIRAARLSEDLRTVTLTTTPLRIGHAYMLAVSAVADRAEKPNSIARTATIPVPDVANGAR